MKNYLIALLLLLSSITCFSQITYEDRISRNRAKSYIFDLRVDRQFTTVVDSLLVTISIEQKGSRIRGIALDQDVMYGEHYEWTLYDEYGDKIWDRAILTLLDTKYECISYFNSEIKVLTLSFLRL